MSDTSNATRRRVRFFVKVAIAVIAVPVAFIVFGLYANWSAKREAQLFCDAIEPGSDISLAVTRFEAKVGKKDFLHYGSDDGKADTSRGHTFIFPGMMFDKADCSVTVTADGKAISKRSQMLDD